MHDSTSLEPCQEHQRAKDHSRHYSYQEIDEFHVGSVVGYLVFCNGPDLIRRTGVVRAFECDQPITSTLARIVDAGIPVASDQSSTCFVTPACVRVKII